MRETTELMLNLVEEHLEDVVAENEEEYFNANSAASLLLKKWAIAKDNPVINKIFGDSLTISFPVDYSIDLGEEYQIAQKTNEKSSRAKLMEKIDEELHYFKREFLDAKLAYSNKGGFPYTINIESIHNIFALKRSFKTHYEKFNKNSKYVVAWTGKDSFEPDHVELHENEKLNSIIKKIISKVYKDDEEGKEIALKEFERITQLESTLIQRSSVKGEIILSIDPIDYLTCSYNNNNWSSCFAPDGCNRLAPYERMLSETSFIAYIKSEDDMPYKSGPVSNKKWRTWVSITEDIVLVHMQNPFNIAALDTIIETFLAAKLGGEFTKETNESKIWINYNAYYEGSNGFLLRKDIEKTPKITIDGNMFCLACFGEREYEDEAGSMLCEDCAGITYCEICGDRLYKGEVYSLDGLDCCEYCFDHNFVCDSCGGVHEKNECYNTPDGLTLCGRCFDEEYTCCEECGEAVRIKDAVVINGVSYCEDCVPE